MNEYMLMGLAHENLKILQAPNMKITKTEINKVLKMVWALNNPEELWEGREIPVSDELKKRIADMMVLAAGSKGVK